MNDLKTITEITKNQNNTAYIRYYFNNGKFLGIKSIKLKPTLICFLLQMQVAERNSTFEREWVEKT